MTPASPFPVVMDVVLFRRVTEVPFLVSKPHHRPLPSAEPSESPYSGIGSRLLPRFIRLRNRVVEAYESFKDRFDSQERICAALRHTSTLRIIHAQGCREEEIVELFHNFLDHQGRKHQRWLWIDCITAVLGTLLMPIPGPNIFFFYPAARALSHYLARKGIRRARQTAVLTFQPDGLVRAIERGRDDLDRVGGEIEALEARYDLSGVRELLADKCT